VRVTLAYPYGGFGPDETIDVDDTLGRRLVREGRARPADPESGGIPAPTVDELRAYARARGLSVREARKRWAADTAAGIDPRHPSPDTPAGVNGSPDDASAHDAEPKE
jgi:hypothetical protein